MLCVSNEVFGTLVGGIGKKKSMVKEQFEEIYRDRAIIIFSSSLFVNKTVKEI